MILVEKNRAWLIAEEPPVVEIEPPDVPDGWYTDDLEPYREEGE